MDKDEFDYCYECEGYGDDYTGIIPDIILLRQRHIVILSRW